MKILFWTESFWPYIGGVETLAARLLPQLKKKGHEFIIVTGHHHYDLPDKDTFQDIPVYRFRFRQIIEDKSIYEMFSIQKKIGTLKHRFQPDLIHLNMFGPGTWFYLKTEKDFPSPLLITMHCGLEGLYHQEDSLIQKAIHSASWITSCSRAIQNDLHTEFPQLSSQSSVIYNGMDTPKLDISAPDFDHPKILCIGRLVRDKGIDIALEAWQQIYHKYPNAQMLIAGDGIERQNLEDLVKSSRMTSTVKFLGWVNPDNILRLINESTMVIVPSRWKEPFCLVALEAAMMKRPVVASRVGGLPEVVDHNTTGILVKNESRDGFVSAISFLLDNPQNAMVLGENARFRATNKFGWQRCVDSYDQIYKEIIGRQE